MAGNDMVQLARESGRSAFGGDAAGYHNARSGYPPELYSLIFDGFPRQGAILEIGAGTGLVTDELLRHDPSRLVVVEPDSALVEFIAQRVTDRRLELVAAPFPDVAIQGPFDLIVCAAAFHWMEPVQALARVRELLAPQGTWAVWWNSYRNVGQGDLFADALSPLLEGIALPPSDRIDKHYSLDEPFHRELLTAAGFTDVEHHCYRLERNLSTNQIVKLYETYSYIRLLDPERRTKFLGSVAELVDRQFGGSAPNVVLTSIYTARP